MIPDTKLAWMAGIIDLKGSFITKKNNQRVTNQVVLAVESQYENIIEELCNLTGVKIQSKESYRSRTFERRGCNDHCPEKHMHVEINNMPSVHRWTVTGAALAIVIYNLQAFLMANKPYVNTMNDCFDNIVTQGKGSGAVQKSIARLAGLGWQIPLLIPSKDNHEFKEPELH